jgi:hypothetical protein
VPMPPITSIVMSWSDSALPTWSGDRYLK